MTEERADALIQFRADDVLELAGLRVQFGVVDGEGVFEESLREAMAPDDISRSLASHGGELRLAVLKFHEMQIRHTAQNFRGGLFRDQGKASCRAGSVQII